MKMLVDQALKNNDYAKSEKEKRDRRNKVVLNSSKKKRGKNDDTDLKQSNGTT